MARFIFRYRGKGAPPSEEMDRIRGVEGVSVVDTAGRMLLVEGPEPRVRAVASHLPEWLLIEEKERELPRPPRPKPERG